MKKLYFSLIALVVIPFFIESKSVEATTHPDTFWLNKSVVDKVKKGKFSIDGLNLGTKLSDYYYQGYDVMEDDYLHPKKTLNALNLVRSNRVIGYTHFQEKIPFSKKRVNEIYYDFNAGETNHFKVTRKQFLEKYGKPIYTRKVLLMKEFNAYFIYDFYPNLIVQSGRSNSYPNDSRINDPTFLVYDIHLVKSPTKSDVYKWKKLYEKYKYVYGPLPVLKKNEWK
ncbi:hypothetical protein ACMGE6_02270 [Macrococcus equi]|uniref:hypothetical protein n=1 Tax=Macrococcus equi TaxID=3395462 RepID=UPI0039BE8749